MLRHRHPRYVAEDFSVAAFANIRGEALDAPQSTSSAPASPSPAAATEPETTPATVSEVGSAPPSAAIIIDDSPPSSTLRAEGRDCPAEVTKERRAEKRARVEVPPGPSSSTPAETLPLPPPQLVPWRPDIEGALGRPLAVTDRTGGNPQVVAALGRACALPLDMAKWETMDSESLMLSSVRLLIMVSV